MAGGKGGGGGKGKAKAAAATTTIPNDVRKTIENLKEMTGNENDEEIYAMLKECGNDPNETAQRLLEQGNFHEVKKKRDRKKEGANPRESADSRGILGPPVWGIRGGRGNDPSRPAEATDAGSGRTSAARKEDLTNQPSRKVNPVSSSTASSADLKINEAASTVRLLSILYSSMTVMANTPIGVVSGGSDDTNTPPSGIVLVAKQSDIRNEPDCTVEPRRASDMTVETGHATGKSVPTFGNSSLSANPVNFPDAAAATAGVNTGFGTNAGTGSDAGSGAGAVGTRENEVNIQQITVVQKPLLSEPKPFGSTPEVRSFSTQGKLGSRSQGIGKNQTSVFSQPSSVSSHGGSSRASSTYGSGSLPAVGQPKGPSKEWKPKAISPSTAQGRKARAVSEELKHSDEAVVYSPPESTVKSDEVTSDLQEKLHDLNVRDVQHVIIPNHIHVPEAIRTRLSFGSFDAAFTISSDTVDDSKSEKFATSDSNSEKFATSDSETPEVVPEAAIEEAMSDQSSLSLMEKEVCVDHPLSPVNVPEDASSGDFDVQPVLIPETTETKERSGVPEPPVTHTPPAYGGFESSEMQALGMFTIPGFVVSQQVDPASLYAQLYRSAVDSDGHISPFSMAGVPTKYDGIVAELATQASESPTEGANLLAMSTSGQAAIATQDAGLMQSSVAVTHQAVPVFRQPAGVHLPHYPANYNPYDHYISQVYIPNPVQQLLSNNALLQQSQVGSGYPSQPTGVKYPASHYKTESNPGNDAPAGSYWPYGSFPVGYNPGSVVSAGNSTANEDLDASQFKESNVYVTGQQSEGSAVWVAAPGCDFSGLQANTFYNLPQGQHVIFTPSQGAQATFAGIYHPLQALQAAAVHPLLQQSQAMPGAVEMVSPTAAVYQQPQLAQNGKEKEDYIKNCNGVAMSRRAQSFYASFELVEMLEGCDCR
ncbi:GBF-interacting protein 1-like protein [Drosera capensis]